MHSYMFVASFVNSVYSHGQVFIFTDSYAVCCGLMCVLWVFFFIFFCHRLLTLVSGGWGGNLIFYPFDYMLGF